MINSLPATSPFSTSAVRYLSSRAEGYWERQEAGMASWTLGRQGRRNREEVEAERAVGGVGRCGRGWRSSIALTRLERSPRSWPPQLMGEASTVAGKGREAGNGHEGKNGSEAGEVETGSGGNGGGRTWCRAGLSVSEGGGISLAASSGQAIEAAENERR